MHCSAHRYSLLGLSAAFLFAAAWMQDTAMAGGFRVENTVFVDDDKEPQSHSTTIFYDGVVYDYLDSPAEITILDPSHGRVILLDTARRVKTELTTEHLMAASERLRAWAGAQKDRFLQFQAEPRFEEKYDPATGELAMESPWISYRVRTEPAKDGEMSRQYRQFCDWYSRLTVRTNPGSRLPFPRLALNERLEREGRLPKVVELTIRSKGDRLLSDKITARSEHLWVGTLLESDRKRVAQTDQFMAMFRPVAFEEYRSGRVGP